jgi:RimJ/RimL family protein N-acetyltransferase
MKTLLFGDYSYEFATRREVMDVFKRMERLVFIERQAPATLNLLSEWEQEKLKEISKDFEHVLQYNLLVYCGEEVIGWSFGVQRNLHDHNMINTGILPEHRNRGIYSALVPVIVEHLKALGVQRIFSRHSMDNNAVIIPKLKAGFVITGIEVDEQFGGLVMLSYYVNEERRKRLKHKIWGGG